MPRTGRPSKLKPALTAAFCEWVAGGLSRTKAAAAVGVTRKTVCESMQFARGGRSPSHAAFHTAVLQAEARFVANRLAGVVRVATPHRVRTVRTTTHSNGRVITKVTEREAFDWRAAAWLLTSAVPEEYGDRRSELVALRREVADLRRSLFEESDSV